MIELPYYIEEIDDEVYFCNRCDTYVLRVELEQDIERHRREEGQ